MADGSLFSRSLSGFIDKNVDGGTSNSYALMGECTSKESK
jgi:hypothetical protein